MTCGAGTVAALLLIRRETSRVVSPKGVGVGMQHAGGEYGDPPGVREVLQKSPLVWKSREAARNGVHGRELGVSSFILSVDLVLVSSRACMIISQYLQLNIEEKALTVE